jgi:phage shock protein PspC (stress-responsive transcriptional regulator)
MKQTINISMGGYAFIVEEDAFARLKMYMQTLRNYFSGKQGGEEILQDIESRIAEIFRENLRGKEVIEMPDVEKMISTIGEPEAYMEEEIPDTKRKESTSTDESETESKRLYRDPDNKIIAGVCGGVSAYFAIDPVWMRLAFVIALLAWGTGPLLYIILWIVIPKARTTAEKLSMKGKKVNLSTIEESIKEDLNQLGKNVDEFTRGESFSKGIRSLTKFIEEIAGGIVRVVIKIAGFILKAGAVFVIALSLIFVCAMFYGFFTGQGTVVLNDEGLHFKNLRELISFIFLSNEHALLFTAGLFLFITIPAIGLIFHAVRLLAGIKSNHRIFSLIALTIWLIGLSICIFEGIGMVNEFSGIYSSKEVKEITQDSTQTLHIYGSSLETPDESNTDAEGNLLISDVRLDIVKNTKDTLTKLQVLRFSRGHSATGARENQEKIVYPFTLHDTILTLPTQLRLHAGEPYRLQSVSMKLFLPEGKKISIDESAVDILHDIDNVQNLHDSELPGHVWKMTPAGLSCDECSGKTK